MKPYIYFYGILVAIYISYNLFFPLKDERAHTAFNILYAAFLFLYIGIMAFILLRKMKK